MQRAFAALYMKSDEAERPFFSDALKKSVVFAILGHNRKGACKMKKHMWRDVVLIAGILLLSALLWLFLRPGENGAAVVITIDGQEVGRYALYEERTITFGEEEYNVLEIKDGKAAVIEANCGDHTCVRTGAVDKAGESIICLPHKLAVQVVGGERSDVDAVVG